MWFLTLYAALIGAHVQKHGTGFRPKDIKFLMELFWNWQTSIANSKDQEKIHNNQLKRTLAQLVADAWANETGKDHLNYKLTRAGLIGLLGQIKKSGLVGSFETFLFCQYFLTSYRDRIIQFVDKAGTPMPLSYRTEIIALINIDQLKRDRISQLEGQAHYLRQRIAETERAVLFAKEQLSLQMPLTKVVQEIERTYPYELNYQKPLTQLFSETSPDLQVWELTEGNALRIGLLWKNYVHLIETQIKILAAEGTYKEI